MKHRNIFFLELSQSLNEVEKYQVKVNALNVRVGDRIFAYCNNKMQTCTVKRILDPEQSNITLSVFTDGQYRRSVVRIIQFRSDALVDLVS